MRNLALVRHALGEYEDALASATEALTLGEAALGPEHPDIATFLNTLGTIQRGRDPPRPRPT
ncbi:tetratricopeptide repeat protein [Nannocystis sp.]|uniref:tetratricopeptide repeat protein n=1 Tax=Nannocystis sp. TaxID=1962667 RepID=UPI0034508900